MTTDSTLQQQRLQLQLQQQQRQSIYLMSQNPNMQFQGTGIGGTTSKRPSLVPIDSYACVPPTRKYKSPYTLSGKQSFTNFVAQIANGPSASSAVTATSALGTFLPMRYSPHASSIQTAQCSTAAAVAAAAITSAVAPAPGMVGISASISANSATGIMIPQPPPPPTSPSTSTAAAALAHHQHHARQGQGHVPAQAATAATAAAAAAAAQQAQPAMLSYSGYSTAGAAAAAAAATSGMNPRTLLSVKHPGVGSAPVLSEGGYDGAGGLGGSGGSGGADLSDVVGGGMLGGGYKPPMQASWFKMNAIHDIEKRALPDFFTGKSPFKTPEVYKEYRDYMITAAQQNRQQNISFAQCRRYLMGDVITLLRVYQFLEHWGLINANISGQHFLTRTASLPQPDRQTSITPPPSSTNASSTSAAAAVPPTADTKSKAPKGGKAQRGQSPQSASFQQPQQAKAMPITVAAAAAAIAHSASKPHPSSEAAPAQEAPKAPATSSSAPVEPSVTVKGEGSAEAKPSECGSAATATVAPAVVVPEVPRAKLVGDWINPEDLAPVEEGVWSEAEKGRLLDALLAFQGKWDDVAAAVGTKTREQCLQYFLQMPIEDPYLEDQITEAALLKREAVVREKTAGDSKAIGLATMLAATVGEAEETAPGAAAARIYGAVERAVKREAEEAEDGEDLREFVKGVEEHSKWVEKKLKGVQDMEKKLADEWVSVEAARKSLITERLVLLQSIAPEKNQDVMQ